MSSFIKSLLYYCIKIMCNRVLWEIDWASVIKLIWSSIHSSDQSHILNKTLVWMSDGLVLSFHLLRVIPDDSPAQCIYWLQKKHLLEKCTGKQEKYWLRKYIFSSFDVHMFSKISAYI